MIDKKHPTHAVRHVSNWDGEYDVLTSLCVLDEATGVFHYWDGGKPVLEYVGDEIIHAWALTDRMAEVRPGDKWQLTPAPTHSADRNTGEVRHD